MHALLLGAVLAQTPAPPLAGPALQAAARELAAAGFTPAEVNAALAELAAGNPTAAVPAPTAIAPTGFPTAGLEPLAAQITAAATANGRRLLITAQEAEAARLAGNAYPLPLLSVWGTGHNHAPAAAPAGLPPYYQYSLLRAGYHFLPAFGMSDVSQLDHPVYDALRADLGEPQMLQTCRDLGLPLGMVCPQQWEQLLSDSPAFAGQKYRIANSGATVPFLGNHFFSPFATALTPWRQAGAICGKATVPETGADTLLGAAQKLHPYPPRVFLYSNNEVPRLTWADSRSAFVADPARAAFAAGRSPEYQRSAVSLGWVKLYGELLRYYRAALSAGWRANASFVGYNASPTTTWRRVSKWEQVSSFGALCCRQHSFPAYRIWDGSLMQLWAPQDPYYGLDSPFAGIYYSPFPAPMNAVFQVDEALAANQRYWNEACFRNTDNAAAAYVQTPELYRASASYGMWLLRSRCVRHWAPSTTPLARPEFRASVQGLAEAVETVWGDARLAEFWRFGRLLPHAPGGVEGTWNDPGFAGDTAGQATARRWFRLTATKYRFPNGTLGADDPQYPLTRKPTESNGQFLNRPQPVWSLCLALGPAGDRKWLVYALGTALDPTKASTPLDLTELELQIDDDGYGAKRTFRGMNAPKAGRFFIFREKSTRADRAVDLPSDVLDHVSRPLPAN